MFDVISRLFVIYVKINSVCVMRTCHIMGILLLCVGWGRLPIYTVVGACLRVDARHCRSQTQSSIYLM